MRWAEGEGVAPDPILTTGSDTSDMYKFFHLEDCDGVPMSATAAIKKETEKFPLPPAVLNRPHFSGYEGDAGWARVNITGAYWYDLNGEAVTYSPLDFAFINWFKPSGSGWVKYNDFSNPDNPQRIIRRIIDQEQGTWQYVAQAWCQSAGEYRDILLCAEMCDPACGLWLHAPTLKAEVAAGDWGAIPEILAQSATAWNDVFFEHLHTYQDTRRDRWLSRSSAGLTLRDIIPSNTGEGYYHPKDPALTGTNRRWIKTNYWQDKSQHRLRKDNTTAKSTWDALQIPLKAGQPTWEEATEDLGIYTIEWSGTAWELYHGATLLAETTGDPQSSGTEWELSGVPQYETKAWDYQETSVAVGPFVDDSGIYYEAEAGATILRLLARPVLRQDYTQRFTRHGEVFPLPGEALRVISDHRAQKDAYYGAAAEEYLTGGTQETDSVVNDRDASGKLRAPSPILGAEPAVSSPLMPTRLARAAAAQLMRIQRHESFDEAPYGVYDADFTAGYQSGWAQGQADGVNHDPEDPLPGRPSGVITDVALYGQSYGYADGYNAMVEFGALPVPDPVDVGPLTFYAGEATPKTAEFFLANISDPTPRSPLVSVPPSPNQGAGAVVTATDRGETLTNKQRLYTGAIAEAINLSLPDYAVINFRYETPDLPVPNTNPVVSYPVTLGLSWSFVDDSSEPYFLNRAAPVIRITGGGITRSHTGRY